MTGSENYIDWSDFSNGASGYRTKWYQWWTLGDVLRLLLVIAVAGFLLAGLIHHVILPVYNLALKVGFETQCRLAYPLGFYGTRACCEQSTYTWAVGAGKAEFGCQGP